MKGSPNYKFITARHYCLFLIITVHVCCCAYCEGVDGGASFGHAAQIDQNSEPEMQLNEGSPRSDLVLESLLRQVLRETDDGNREAILDALLNDELRNKVLSTTNRGYGYHPAICKVNDTKRSDYNNSTTTPPDEFPDSTPYYYDEIPEITHPDIPDYEDNEILPEGCHYFTVNETDTCKNYLLCSDANINEVPSNIPPKLDVFEMSATNVECVRANAFRYLQVRMLNLKENKIQDVAPEAFRDVVGLEHLNMNDNKLLVPIWFRVHSGLENLQVIELEHNDICMNNLGQYHEYNGAPDYGANGPYFTSIRYISLRGNFLELVPSFFFARFRGTEFVKKIDLSQCKLTYIDAAAFNPFKQVDIVDLSENPDLMNELTMTAAGLSKVKINHLILSYNSLQRIPSGSLVHVSASLVALELRGNSLLQLNDASFPYMPKLAEINLDYCKISKISPRAFETLPNLQVLSLKGNVLTAIPAALGALVHLRVLRLTDNKDSKDTPFGIATGVFESLTNLETLYLNNVRLKSLNSSTFEGLTNLKHLHMDNAQLVSIADGVFLQTPNLAYLDLKGNPLGSMRLNRNVGHGLENLKTLNMSNCGLSFSAPKPVIRPSVNATPNEPFQYLTSLEYLDLSGNQITQLYPELFRNLLHLHYLDLSRNKIQPWAAQIFKNNTYLSELYLSENLLVSTAECMLEDFKMVRKKLDLTENPFSCDAGICQMKAAVLEGELQFLHWNTVPSLYRCYKTPQERVSIKTLPDEDCPSPAGEPSTTIPPVTTPTPTEPQGPRSDEAESGPVSSTTTLLIVGAALLVVSACAVIVYKRRKHFRYSWPWFDLKLKFRKYGVNDGLLLRKKNRESDFFYDVFISYSHHDSPFIQEQLVPTLEGKGKLLMNDDQEQQKQECSGPPARTAAEIFASYVVDELAFKVCLHERDFEVGTSITENIIECVDNSRKVVIVVSRNYLESQWCLFEMNLAYHRLVEVRRKSFLLILLEEIPAESRTKVLNYLMKSTTYLRWPGASANGNEQALFWTRLKHALKSGTNPSSKS